jgi:hypothetical protein
MKIQKNIPSFAKVDKMPKESIDGNPAIHHAEDGHFIDMNTETRSST